jgi:hypothetical protein
MSRNKDKYRLWEHHNGTIYIVWTEREATSKTGAQTKRVSTGTTDWRTAEQYRAQFIAGLNNAPPPTEPTIKYLLERYQQERGPYTRSQKTIAHNLTVLIPFFGDLYPSHITNRLLRQFAEQNKHLSPGTIIRRLSVLKAALRYAEGNRWIDPLPALRMPVSQSPPRDIWLSCQ